jgi:hypothetical protein
MACMLLPPDFNLSDLEACRRHQVILATLAETVPVMELHINLAEFYQERIAALVGSEEHRSAQLLHHVDDDS